MARPLRLEFPGTLYRVTSRGNARQKIFLDDEGSEAFPGLEVGVRLCYFDNLRGKNGRERCVLALRIVRRRRLTNDALQITTRPPSSPSVLPKTAASPAQ